MFNLSCGVDHSLIVPMDDRTVTAIKAQQWDNGTTLPTLQKQLEHVAVECHPTAQDVLPITTNVSWLPGLVRRLALSRSPVSRLPPELLTYIFEIYVAHGIESKPTSVHAHGPFCLARVCKLWRAVAESNSRLWTSAQFDFPDSHQSREDDLSTVQTALDLHLKLSGERPMTLTFADHRVYHSSTEDLISLLVDRLRAHASRWKRISFQLSCGYFPLLFTFTSSDLSSLEHLYISGDVFAQPTINTLHLKLESAKKLKSLTYNGPGYSVDDKIDVHWESLAEVSLGFSPHKGRSFTSSLQFKHLSRCQSLTTLSMGIDRPVWPVVSNGETITLPCLQTLRVRRLFPDSDARVAIDPLILPQLRRLEIDASSPVNQEKSKPWQYNTFSDLLERSGCTLQHLSIQDVDFSSDDVLRCLALSNELASFRFIPCPLSQDISDIIRTLHVSHSTTVQTLDRLGVVRNGPFLPRLREIALATSVEEYLGLMVEMFRSRVDASAVAADVATLRRVDVVLFDTSLGTGISVPGAPLGSVGKFHAELAQWVCENKSRNGGEDEDGLEASITVDSPYLSKYIIDGPSSRCHARRASDQ